MNTISEVTRRLIRRVTKHEKVRFGLVGVVNTIVDFGVFNLLVLFAGIAVFPANIASTTIAMLASFGLNKKTVFKTNGGAKRQLVLFVVVTLVGVWIVQSFILINVYNYFIAHSELNDTLLLNGAKIVGIAFGLVWNYIWYSRVVFKDGKRAKNS